MLEMAILSSSTFRLYVSSVHATENLDCLNAIVQFDERMESEWSKSEALEDWQEAQRHAVELWKDYLHTRSDNPINIGFKLREEVERKLNIFEIDLETLKVRVRRYNNTPTAQEAMRHIFSRVRQDLIKLLRPQYIAFGNPE